MLTKSIQDATLSEAVEGGGTNTKVDIHRVVTAFSQSSSNPNMDDRGCEEALDSLFAIYKVGTPPVFSKHYLAFTDIGNVGRGEEVYCERDHSGHRATHRW